MAIRAATVRWIAFLLLAGVLTVVLIATLLLVGVNPHSVFAPGFVVRSWLAQIGIQAHNRVGVLTTVALYWLAIVVIWSAVARALRR